MELCQATGYDICFLKVFTRYNLSSSNISLSTTENGPLFSVMVFLASYRTTLATVTLFHESLMPAHISAHLLCFFLA